MLSRAGSRGGVESVALVEVCLCIWLARPDSAEARRRCSELVLTSGGDVISCHIILALGILLECYAEGSWDVC